MKNIFLLLTLVLCAFINKDKGLVDVIDITSTPKSTMTNLSEIASDIDYIPLETNENSLINRILNLKVQGNYIYVGTLESVLCFSKSGKYLFGLSKKGRGPDEYEFLLDFDVNASNTVLAIPSRKNIVLYKQTDNGFTFLNRIDCLNPINALNFTGKSDNILLQFSNSDGTIPYSRQLINLKGDILKSWLNYMMYKKLVEKMYVSHRWENTSYNLQNNLFLKTIGNDTIFKFNEINKAEPFLILDTKDKRITPDVRADVKSYAEHMQDYISIQRIFGSERFFYYTYSYNKKSNHEIYDQLKKIRYSVPEKEYLKDDISGGINFEPLYCNDGLFYSWVEAIKFKSHTSSDLFTKAKVKNSVKHSALKSLSEQVTEFDNPIIIAAKIR